MTREEQRAKDAFVRKNPKLTKLVDELLQTEDAALLLKRFETIENQKTPKKPK